MPRVRAADAPRVVHRCARIALRTTTDQRRRLFAQLVAGGDVWAWVLALNEARAVVGEARIVSYQALCRELSARGRASFSELSVSAARPVLRRCSDASSPSQERVARAMKWRAFAPATPATKRASLRGHSWDGLTGYRAAVAVVIAIDAGTSGVRALALDEDGHVVTSCYRELTQHFPAPGLVEHDAAEIWSLVETTLAELQAELAERSLAPVAIGIANQRETAVAWDRSTGRPCHRAIVWQDRRTAARCVELAQAGHLPLVRERTGLVLDPYFSGTKWSWMLEYGGVEPSGSLALGTVDDWICWNLTGGAESGVHVTDPSNASRTLCYDIVQRAWSAELCDLFGVPIGALGEILPSACRYGAVAAGVADGSLQGVPVSGVVGDQQAALFGHACHLPGDTKVTYGTGSFVLMNLGTRRPPTTGGLLTTVAWDLGEHVRRGRGRRLQLRPRRLHLLVRRDDPVVARRSRSDRRGR